MLDNTKRGNLTNGELTCAAFAEEEYLWTHMNDNLSNSGGFFERPFLLFERVYVFAWSYCTSYSTS